MALYRAPRRLSLYIWAHLLLLVLSPLALAHPYNTSLVENGDLVPRQNADKPFTLRIMPLGASITAGYGTFPQNGYRKPLRDQLRWRGWPVNMVGSLVDGDPEKFHNRQHEGHKSKVVGDMIGFANNTIPRKPNLVLINAGTNDADPGNDQDIPNTATRMEAVLNHLYKNIDGVTIILSTLIPRKDAWDINVNSINAGYRTLAQKFASEGQKIVLAELNNGFLDLNVDYYDNLHPNEKGAAKLAAVWDQAILEAESRGFLTEPIDTGIPDHDTDDDGDNTYTQCDVTLGSGRGPVRTQQGSGFSDGPYVHTEGDIQLLETGQNLFGLVDGVEKQLYFAQLVNVNNVDPGQERDEIVYCLNNGSGGPGDCIMNLNVDGAFTGEPAYIDVGLKCLTRGIRWGDVNGDGLDDFICIDQAANMYVSINQGGNPPTFKPTGNGGLIRKGEPWASQDRVRLGDMDGDGRLDYCAIDDQGDIYCWRNGGVGLAPTTEEGGYWQGLVGGQPTFYAQHEPEGIDGVRLVDINGDGRADWVYVYQDGSSKIFINQRGSYDEDGKGLRPHWVEVEGGHTAIDYISSPKQVYFGRVQGTGRVDRIPTKSRPLAGPVMVMDLYLGQNEGHGGTKLKGDGVFYCDMFGRGYDDYLWVLSTGEITLFENIQSPPEWGQHGVIIDINRDRKSIHFGDWDGDGLCDILAVERHTGRVEWWRNTYKKGDKSPTFDGPKWAVDTGDNRCTEGWGIGLYDQGLRFADLDGDKRVDYLCMEKDGRTVGHLNKGNGLQYKGQVKKAPSGHFDRANFKWADVNGDGLADLIWIDKFTGKARVWKNGDFTPSAGSSMTWISQGTVFEGHGRGQNIHFPKLGDKGRADYHDVYPDTAVANTWFNECSREGEGEDDYPVPIDPNLPTPTDEEPPTTTRIELPGISVIETFTNLVEKDLGPAAAGDIFAYDLDDGSDRNVVVALVDTAEDFPNIDCGVHYVSGDDGDTLSCVAESVSWLFYSIYQLGGPVATNPVPDKRDGSSPVRHAQVHDEWKPRGDCSTTHCMLMATAPLHTWVSVGNGTSNGVLHEHHFANFGNVVAHQVQAGGLSPNELGKRGYEFASGTFRTSFFDFSQPDGGKYLSWYTRPSDFTALEVSEKIGGYVEQTVARTDHHKLCIGFGVNNDPPYYGFVDLRYAGHLDPTYEEIEGDLQDCRDYVGDGRPSSGDTLVCYTNATRIDKSLALDEGENDDVGIGPLPWQGGRLKRSMTFVRGSFSSLFGRTATSGSEESYTVQDVLHGTGTLQFVAPTYPNGDNGESLNEEKDNGDETAYGLLNPGNCLDGSLTDDANTDVTTPNHVLVATEHVFPERQGGRNFLEYVQDPRMNLGNGTVLASPLAPVTFQTLAEWADVPYHLWINNPLPAGFDTSILPAQGSFFIDFADAMGSSSNPTVMTNLEVTLNGYKARVLSTDISPTADDVFDPLAETPTLMNTEQALTLLRLGFGVFNYLNDGHILNLTRDTYRDQLAAAEQFDTLARAAGLTSNMQGLLPDFLRSLALRVTIVHRRYMSDRLDQLAAPWTELQTSGTAQQQLDAFNALGTIMTFRGQINTVINYNADSFINRP